MQVKEKAKYTDKYKVKVIQIKWLRSSQHEVGFIQEHVSC